MTYRDNVTWLANLMEISNDPRLNEEDLTIARLRFFSNDGTETVIEATPMNCGGRLFIQSHLTVDTDLVPHDVIECNDHFRRQAAEYFAELWEENPDSGKRPLLDAIRQHEYIGITFKWDIV